MGEAKMLDFIFSNRGWVVIIFLILSAFSTKIAPKEGEYYTIPESRLSLKVGTMAAVFGVLAGLIYLIFPLLDDSFSFITLTSEEDAKFNSYHGRHQFAAGLIRFFLNVDPTLLGFIFTGVTAVQVYLISRTKKLLQKVSNPA
jgi:hypothetical protein